MRRKSIYCHLGPHGKVVASTKLINPSHLWFSLLRNYIRAPRLWKCWKNTTIRQPFWKEGFQYCKSRKKRTISKHFSMNIDTSSINRWGMNWRIRSKWRLDTSGKSCSRLTRVRSKLGWIVWITNWIWGKHNISCKTPSTETTVAQSRSKRRLRWAFSFPRENKIALNVQEIDK